jgi:VanZ family protein
LWFTALTIQKNAETLSSQVAGRKMNPCARGNILIWAAIPAIWLTVIFLLSSDPNSAQMTGSIVGGTNNLFVRKMAHFLEYTLLFVLIKNPLALVQLATGSSIIRSRHHNLKVFVAVVLFACMDEWHQSFVPLRCSSAVDVLIDTLGALTGWAASAFVDKHFLNQTQTMEGLVQEKITSYRSDQTC